MHPCKSYWSETNINTPKKKKQQKKKKKKKKKNKSKKGHSSANFGGWLSISNFTCILRWYNVLQSLNEINASLQKLLSGNEQQKTKSKKDHNSAKIRWLITNIELDLYFLWYKVLQNLNEIHTSLQKLFNGNEKCDDDTDAAAADDDDAGGQHDPYVSAMLRRRHKNRRWYFIQIGYISWRLAPNVKSYFWKKKKKKKK